MIIAGFLGEDTAPVAAAAASAAVPTAAAAPAVALPTGSRAERDPFTRPAQARSSFVPRSFDTGFIPEFSPFPSVMLPQMVRSPMGIRNPLRSEPQGGGVPTAGTLPADPSGQSSVPAGVPSPVKMRPGRMMPPWLVQATGLMPSIRGVRTGHVNPTALVAGGRKPGMV